MILRVTPLWGQNLFVILAEGSISAMPCTDSVDFKHKPANASGCMHIIVMRKVLR